MSCDGSCFDVDSWVPEQEISSPSTFTIERDSQFYGIDACEVYTPLQQWQTRVLRLHPGSSIGLGKYDLHADLLVVNLHIVDGVTVDKSERIIEYTAISYVWGPPDNSCSLSCNGSTKLISRTVAAALETLRHPTNPTYLWIDAICINQVDTQERADQVAKMLDIFKKAQSVIAWMGEPGPNTSLAFAAIRSSSMIVEKLVVDDRGNSHRTSTHRSICFDRLRAIHSALMNLYDLHRRPWLRRTWIRQEVYAARQLVLQYGHHKILLDDLVVGASLLATIRFALPENDEMLLPELNTMLTRLLEEAQSNAVVPYSGVKPPRDLIEVLRSSNEFELEDERDTVYAVLGMCSIPTVTLMTDPQHPRRRDALLVDYSKSLIDVYHDTSLYMLNKIGDSEYWTRMYDVYKRSPMHRQGLASWAIDWRTGVLGQNHVSTVRQNLGPYQLSQGYSDSFSFSDRRIHAINSSPVWRPPSPHRCSRAILVVQARVLNYIAYVSDLTCDPEDFFSVRGPGSGPYRHRNDLYSDFQIGPAGVSVHARREGPVGGTHLFTRRPDHAAVFDAKIHAWRIALLGVAHDAQICLVPASAKKGDLVVALASKMLPVLLRPVARSHGGEIDAGGAGRLFNSENDPYERVPYRLRRRTPFEMNDVPSHVPTLIGISMLTVATIPSIAYVIGQESRSSKIMLNVYGASPLCVFVCIWLYFKYRFNGWIATYSSSAKSLAESGTSKASETTVKVSTMTFISAAMMAHDLVRAGSLNLLGAYCGALVTVSLGSFLWYFFIQMEHRIVIEIRRQKVLEHLDDAKNTIGEDYEFHGAMFVRRSRPSPWMSSHVQPRWLRWCLLKSYFVAHRYISDRLPLNIALFDRLLNEVYAGGERETDEFLWLERPIQELKIH